jgi:hypothetical protein
MLRGKKEVNCYENKQRRLSFNSAHWKGETKEDIGDNESLNVLQTLFIVYTTASLLGT